MVLCFLRSYQPCLCCAAVWQVILVLPSLLAGLCLNSQGLEEIKKAQPFSKILAVIHSPKYQSIMDVC